MEKKNKKEDKKLSKGFQNGTRETPTEANVEMDSRLLVALLTVRSFLIIST